MCTWRAWLRAVSTAGIDGLAWNRCAYALSAGRDVIVPQFLGRLEFIDELANVAIRADAMFVEMALWTDRASAIAASTVRRAAPSTQSHRDAAALVDRSEHADPIGQMYDAFVTVVDRRPATRRVDVVPGDIEQTYARFVDALDGR